MLRRESQSYNVLEGRLTAGETVSVYSQGEDGGSKERLFPVGETPIGLAALIQWCEG